MQITRMLQTIYWLEPAGSHGAQGLDDYHFAIFSESQEVILRLYLLTVPFLLVFGSAQLKGHKYLRPKAIHDNDILEEFSKDYMYFSYIKFINSVSRETTTNTS